MASGGESPPKASETLDFTPSYSQDIGEICGLDIGAYIDQLTAFVAAPCCRITPSANPTYEGLSVLGRSD